ncbi:MAG: U32 family peptidase [Haloarculaceae archaeon]
MNIFAPINSLADAEAMIPLGADELYCGVIPGDWMGEYNDVKPPNRRANEKSQVGSFDELERIARLCDERDVSLYITLNAHFYSDRQASMLSDLVAELSTWDGITGYIIADVHFMREVRDVTGDAEILVSTGSTVFNGRTASFLADIGADGIHLPRHLTVDEIGEIARTAPDSLDLYAFVLNRNCLNIDGNCTLLHNPPIEHEDAERVPCFQTFDRSPVGGGAEAEGVRMFEDPRRNKEEACGICSLYRFDEVGLAGVKMVGRAFPLERKKSEVQLLDSAREHLRTASSEREFTDAVERLATDHGIDCSVDSCYYPTVMEQ